MALVGDFNDDGHFTLANIPFGVVSTSTNPEVKVTATRLHSHVYIIPDMIKHGLLQGLSEEVKIALNQPTLNPFAALGPLTTHQVRKSLQQALSSADEGSPLSQCNHGKSEVEYHLPVAIGDFTDFSCSLNHVQNAGEAIFGKRSTPPCFMYYPPGYTGRSSSIVPSGTPIRRPLGQYRDKSGNVVYGPSQMLDYELEVGAIIGQPTKHGQPVPVTQAEQHIFGLVLLNDWSARDIQALEMSPLGPLNGKSFGTTISPWVITLDALQPFACPPPAPHDPSIVEAPYLMGVQGTNHYAVRTEVHLVDPQSQTADVLCSSTFDSIYWPLSALVAHQTSNGCPLRTGDMLGTGTISGSEPGSFGCLLESTKGAKQSIALSNGKSRTYLEDGDEIRLTAWAGELGSDFCVGFGEACGVLEKALNV